MLNAIINLPNLTGIDVFTALKSIVPLFAFPTDPTKCMKIMEAFAKRYFNLNSEGSPFIDAGTQVVLDLILTSYRFHLRPCLVYFTAKHQSTYKLSDLPNDHRPKQEGGKRRICVSVWGSL